MTSVRRTLVGSSRNHLCSRHGSAAAAPGGTWRSRVSGNDGGDISKCDLKVDRKNGFSLQSSLDAS